MNNQNLNDNSKETKNNVEIVDANLLNPFQSNQNPNNSNANVPQNSAENENLVEKPEAVSNFNSNEIVNGVNQSSISNEQNFYQNNNTSHTNTIPVQTRIQENNNSSVISNDISNMSNINKQNEMIDNNNIQNENNNMQSSMNQNSDYDDSRLNSLSKTLKNDMLTFAVLQFAIVILQTLLDVSYVSNAIAIVYFGIYILCYFGVKNQRSYAGKVGIIISVLMILSIISGDILDFILGIFLLSHSIKYNKAIKANGKNEKDLKYILTGVGVIILVAGITVFIKLQGNKLQCTRQNGEKIVVKFGDSGITSYSVNGSEEEDVLYELQFLQKFLHAKQTEKDYLTAFKNIVKEYEQNNGATCK